MRYKHYGIKAVYPEVSECFVCFVRTGLGCAFVEFATKESVSEVTEAFLKTAFGSAELVNVMVGMTVWYSRGTYHV